MDDHTKSDDVIWPFNYSRKGFVGSHTIALRSNYPSAFCRIEGNYAPKRFDVSQLETDLFSNPRALPLALLSDGMVSVEVSNRSQPMPFALSNVEADEVHYVVSGSARFDTFFGVLDVRPGDFVLIPRASIYRVSEIREPLCEIIVSTPGELTIDPSPPVGVLNVDRHVDAPEPYAESVGELGEFEMVYRHGGELTSYFFDFDPLPNVGLVGGSLVHRFNLEHVQGLSTTKGGITPPRLINDETGHSLLYHLGARRSDRPPLHCNADYDEVIVYASGPDSYGDMTVPGMIAWTPKGVAHHGAPEDVADGYEAWLFETRASLKVTEEGAKIGQLMETGMYGLHNTEA